MDKKIDGKIKSLVAQLNLAGIRTTGSCEGHIYKGAPAPWVKVTTFRRDIDIKMEQKARRFLRSFYSSRRRTRSDIRLTTTKARHGFWIHNGGAAFIRWRQNVDRNVSRLAKGGKSPSRITKMEAAFRAKKLPKYQKEADAFARFLDSFHKPIPYNKS